MVIWMSWKNWRAYLLGFSTGPIFSDRTGPGPDRGPVLDWTGAGPVWNQTKIAQ